MRRRMLQVITLLIVILFIHIMPVHAGRVRVSNLPGNFTATSTFCTDGISITATGTLAGGTAVVSIVSLVPPGLTGPILDFSGSGAVSGTVIVPFTQNQVPGTPVTMFLDLIENGASSTGGTGVDSSGIIGDCAFGDAFGAGRVNRDVMAPAAIYCKNNGIEVWAVDTAGTGHLAFRATSLEISSIGVPSVNTLIDSGYGIGLYRLTSGEYQVNAPRHRPPSYFLDIVPETSGTRNVGTTTTTTTTVTTTTSSQPTGTVTHVIQRGENLFRIALRYGTTIDAIAKANNIADVRRIYAGDTLIIPVGAVPTSTTTTTTTTEPPAPTSTTSTSPASASTAIGSDYIYTFKSCSSSS